ncbi:putative acetyltransferase [Brachybacterium sp. AOP43-C2-M15]|uniref:putative acetyltransferase n=1 Tax=Brachybacterium sp. AOP43-C2-M15 TaxID=3457661 RepID=UPI004033B0E4
MTVHDDHRVRAGWAPFLQAGRRVVLRYAIDRERSPHGETMTDALGTILEADERTVRVMTRRGQVRVPRALVIAAKEVPPPPVRRQGPTAP